MKQMTQNEWSESSDDNINHTLHPLINVKSNPKYLWFDCQIKLGLIGMHWKLKNQNVVHLTRSWLFEYMTLYVDCMTSYQLYVIL